MGMPEGEGTEAIFEAIMSDNCPKLMSDTTLMSSLQILWSLKTQ